MERLKVSNDAIIESLNCKTAMQLHDPNLDEKERLGLNFCRLVFIKRRPKIKSDQLHSGSSVFFLFCFLHLLISWNTMCVLLM